MENPSDISGILPDGQFSTDSRFYFCCRSDGSSSTPIDMPSDEPFILFPTTKNCQEMLGQKLQNMNEMFQKSKFLLPTYSIFVGNCQMI